MRYELRDLYNLRQLNMTKIWVMSDIHHDVWGPNRPFQWPDPLPDFDVLVVAGDIGESAVRSIRWLANSGIKKPKVYVRGNHDSYRQAIDTELAKARAEAEQHPNIYLLENDTKVICGTRFVGATLWTDYKLMRADQQEVAMMHASSAMNDHDVIRVAAKQYSRFLPSDALRMHNDTVAYINLMVSEPFNGPTVIVTHHAPCIHSVPARYFGDLLNAAYASHLEHLVDKAAGLWIHGHIHQACRYKCGDGEVVCNPRGYPHEASGFDPALVIDVGVRALTSEGLSA